jgi:hypothetical protein
VRIAQLEKTQAELNGQLSPYLANLQAQQRALQNRPPIDISRIDTDPNIKPSDLLNYLRWEAQQTSQNTLSRAEYTARATLSEQNARGQFNAATMGEGNDYDSMVNRYVSPLVAQNPGVEALIAQVFPTNPAAGRMVVAALVHAVDRAGDDLVKGLKGVIDGVGAYAQGARETRKAISRGAKAAAANVMAGARSGAGAAARRQKLETADDVWGLTPRAFDKMWNQPGR